MAYVAEEATDAIADLAVSESEEKEPSQLDKIESESSLDSNHIPPVITASESKHSSPDPNSVDDLKVDDLDLNESTQNQHSTTDIMQLHGVPPFNTNALSWNDIDTEFQYTEEEVSGAIELQKALCLQFEIDALLMNTYFPPFECLRYFCGCSMEMDRALNKWSHSVDMFREYGMREITDFEIAECIDVLSRSIAFGGFDRNGARIVTIKYSLFFFSEMKKLNVFLLCGFYLWFYLTLNVDAHRNRLCLICDLKGFTLSNFSWTVERTGIHFFQKVLPVRIGKIIVVDAPWIAHHAMKLVLPLLPQKLRDRVRILKRETLDEVVERSQLPMLIGGLFDQEFVEQNEGRCFFEMVMKRMLYEGMDFGHFKVKESKDLSSISNSNLRMIPRGKRRKSKTL